MVQKTDRLDKWPAVATASNTIARGRFWETKGSAIRLAAAHISGNAACQRRSRCRSEWRLTAIIATMPTIGGSAASRPTWKASLTPVAWITIGAKKAIVLARTYAQN